MLDRVKRDTIAILSKVQVRRPEDVQVVEQPPTDMGTLRFQHAAAPSLTAAPAGAPPPPAAAARAMAGGGAGAAAAGRPPPGFPSGGPSPAAAAAGADPVAPYVREQPKVGRNEPCPCGSGKKYKQCHGRLT